MKRVTDWFPIDLEVEVHHVGIAGMARSFGTRWVDGTLVDDGFVEIFKPALDFEVPLLVLFQPIRPPVRYSARYVG